MVNISVFKSLLKKETYEKYRHVIFQIPSLESETKSILNSIRSYYDTYPEKDIITVDELKLHFGNVNPAIRKPETYQRLLDSLYSADINNVQLLTDSINRLAETATANLILQECIELTNKYKPEGLAGIHEHLKFYDQLTSSVSGSEGDVYNPTLEEMIRMRSAQHGFSWRLEFLRTTTGALRPGTLAHIFAYSETGKTSLGVSELVNFAEQLVAPDCVLYMSNEESVERTRWRAMSALFGYDEDLITQNHIRAWESWERRVSDKLKFLDDVGHIGKVEQYVKDFKPRLIMIDQGPKVDIAGDMNDVKKLQQLYNMYRQMAVANDMVVITLGQAETSCANKKYLNLNNMDMSKVGIPGELDLAIGIGKTDEEGMEKVRYLHVCKNKLTGTHGKGQVIFDNKKCTFVQGGSNART